jgi:hypothetical protein
MLTADLRPPVVKPGGTIAVDVTIQSARDVPSIISLDTCHAPVTAVGNLAVPWEPVGRAWDGLEGAFKQFALDQGLAPGAGSARLPYPAYARTEPCPQDYGELTLAPGGSTFARLLFEAIIAGAVPALPGDIPIHLTVAYDRPDPLPTPDCNPICGMMQVPWKILAADGTIRVAGDAPRIVSAGEALDGLLAEERFTTWLAEQPATTWTNANLFLQNATGGPVPPGPSWEIDLFREQGVPRNWAIGFVDVFSGELLDLTFCNDPCDR